MPTLSLSKNQGSRAGIRDIYHIALGGLDGLFPFHRLGRIHPPRSPLSATSARGPGVRSCPRTLAVLDPGHFRR